MLFPLFFAAEKKKSPSFLINRLNVKKWKNRSEMFFCVCMCVCAVQLWDVWHFCRSNHLHCTFLGKQTKKKKKLFALHFNFMCSVKLLFRVFDSEQTPKNDRRKKKPYWKGVLKTAEPKKKELRNDRRSRNRKRMSNNLTSHDCARIKHFSFQILLDFDVCMCRVHKVASLTRWKRHWMAKGEAMNPQPNVFSFSPHS